MNNENSPKKGFGLPPPQPKTGENKSNGDASREERMDFSPQGVVRPRTMRERSDHEEPKPRKRFKSAQKAFFEAFRPAPGSTGKSEGESETLPAASREDEEDEEETVPIRRHDEEPKKTSAEQAAAWLRRTLRMKTRLWPAVIVALIVILWVAHQSSVNGIAEGRRLAEAEAIHSPVVMLPDTAAQFEKAMNDLREGNTGRALASLQQIDEASVAYPSLSYLVCVAALQKGDVELAARKAAESIRKGERVSDSLALQAVLETQKASDPTWVKMGNPVVRAEELLRQAIAIDPANPYPHFELANLLRFQHKRDEAVREIRLARSLLNPMDSHLVMDVTASFMAMEEAPAESFSRESPSTDEPRKLFPAALAAMRTGDFQRAADLLSKCETLVSPDVFDYLVNDPSLRRYADASELQRFYKSP